MFQSTWVHLTSENENWFGAPPAPSLSYNGRVVLSRRADKILLRRVPGAAVEKTGFYMSGCFVVDFTGAAERGWRGCVLRVNIIIFENNNIFIKSQHSAISERALFTKWPYLRIPVKAGFGVSY